MKDEVRTAIQNMKGGKASGPDNIAIEQIIEALEEFSISKTTILLNEIYDTGHIPKDMLKSCLHSTPKESRSY